MARKYRPKAAQEGDPLVPIDCDVLAAAIAEQGESPAGFAARVGVSKQSLAHLLHGGGAKRCRRERRLRFARALRLPESALEGAAFASPAAFMSPGFEYLHTRRTELAASRLLNAVARACRRDRYGAEESVAIQQSVGLLIRAGEWRRRVLAAGTEDPRGVSLEPRGHVPWPADGRRQVDREHEAAVLALIRSLEHALAPWLSGAAALDLEGLARFAGLDAARARGERPPSGEAPGRPRDEFQQLFAAPASPGRGKA